MALSTLPSELLDLICSHVEGKKDLSNLALVSKTLNLPAERSLYRTARIQTSSQGRSFRVAALRENRSRYVRDFCLDTWATAEAGQESNVMGSFDAEWLAIFPNLETLSIFADPWHPSVIAAQMGLLRDGLLLPRLKSCVLAFKPGMYSEGLDFWIIHPFEDLILHPALERLSLAKASTSTLGNQTLDAKERKPLRLKSLLLSSCCISFEWLHDFFRLTMNLEELSIIVTLSDSAYMAELFSPENKCAEPLWANLQRISYFSLLSVGTGPRVVQFAHFHELKILSVSASDLFGPMNEANIPSILKMFSVALPSSLERLNLMVHSLDILKDREGDKEGIFKVLHEVLGLKSDRIIPRLRRIILRVLTNVPQIPVRLMDYAKSVGVECRPATFEEAARLMDRSFMRIAMS